MVRNWIVGTEKQKCYEKVSRVGFELARIWFEIEGVVRNCIASTEKQKGYATFARIGGLNLILGAT